MKKNLSKKISLLLCSTFFLSSIMGSSFVYAVRTRSQTKTDARSNTTTAVGAKKRTRTGDSESNKRTRLNPSEPAAGEKPTDKGAQKNVTGKETTGKNAHEAAAGKETTGKNAHEAAAGEKPTGMSTSEANARSEHSRIPPESRYNPRENRRCFVDAVLCIAEKKYRIFLRIVDLYDQLCIKYGFHVGIDLANPREDGNMPDMVECVLNSIEYEDKENKKKAFKELADYIRANMRLLLDPTQCSLVYFVTLYNNFEMWARNFYVRNGLYYQASMPIINY